MNNKPVAWMNNKGDIILPAMQANKEYNIPLYTYPTDLTDKEINEVFSKTWLDLKDYKDFARAILRKAQEK